MLPTEASKVGGLPPCEATTEAARIPPPGSFRSGGYYNPTNAFSGHGNILGSSSTAGTKRGTSYSEDDGSGGEVSDESNARSRRPRLEDQQDFMTEDEQMALAIADSLKRSSIPTTPLPSTSTGSKIDDSDSDVEIISSATTTRAPLQLPRFRHQPAPESLPTEKQPETKSRRSRADQEEEDELNAAIAASMIGSSVTESKEDSKGKGKAVAEPEAEEEFDEPSAEELRRRRLARFG